MALTSLWLAPASAQSSGVVMPVDTGVALTPEMELLDRSLLATSRGTLERWGNTFRAFAFYVADTVGPSQVFEVGLENSVDSRQPSVTRDSLRAVLRRRQAYEPHARTIGIITDSIAGPVEEAIDGVEGPGFERRTITELEDRSGRCRRIDRPYHFANDPPGDWGFGTVVYGPPVVSRCEPLKYWAAVDSASLAPPIPLRPRLAAPIVRALEISSLNNYFSVVGKFHGDLTVYDDSIVVRFDSLVATRRLPNDTQVVRVDSIRVGVGVGDEESWSPVDDSRALRIGRVLKPRGTIVRRNVRFVVHHERREADATSWIVVTFHISVGHRGDPKYQPLATTYAHSVRGVLAEDEAK